MNMLIYLPLHLFYHFDQVKNGFEVFYGTRMTRIVRIYADIYLGSLRSQGVAPKI